MGTKLESDNKKRHLTIKEKEIKSSKISATVENETEMKLDSEVNKETIEGLTPKFETQIKEHEENGTEKATPTTITRKKRTSTDSNGNSFARGTKDDEKKINRPQKRNKTGKETISLSKKEKNDKENDKMNSEEDKQDKKKEKNAFPTEEEEVFHLNEICIARDAGRLS